MTSSKKRKNLTELEERIEAYFQNARSRAKRENVKFNLTREYIQSIMTSHCPIFHTMFDWTPQSHDKEVNPYNAPELDKVMAQDGYIIGNVAFLCHEANRVKDKGTMQQHYDIADFMHEFEQKQKEDPEYVKQRELASVPTDIYRTRKNNYQLGAVPTTGTGEDDDNIDNHCGADARKDADHRTQESSGDSVGTGSKTMESPQASLCFENYGVAVPAIAGFVTRGGYIPNKS